MGSLYEVSSDLDPEANNSSTRLSAVAGLIIFNTSLASSISPFFTINHLGLLGTKMTKTRNSKAGNDSIPNIHLQFSPLPPIKKLDRNAIKIPKTILNWKRAVNRPLFSRGEISEIYIGATTDDTPTPNPPINLKNMRE